MYIWNLIPPKLDDCNLYSILTFWYLKLCCLFVWNNRQRAMPQCHKQE